MEKNFEIFYLVRVRARYKPSLVFRLSLVLSMVKFSAGIQLFGLKTTSHGKPDLKNSFSRSDLRHGEVQGEVGVQGHPLFQHLPVLCGYSISRPENQAGLIPGPGPEPKKNFKFFFQKIEPKTMPIHHVKGQPAASTYVRKKGCPTCDTNRGTPCSPHI